MIWFDVFFYSAADKSVEDINYKILRCISSNKSVEISKRKVQRQKKVTTPSNGKKLSQRKMKVSTPSNGNKVKR